MQISSVISPNSARVSSGRAAGLGLAACQPGERSLLSGLNCFTGPGLGARPVILAGQNASPVMLRAVLLTQFVVKL